jgi:hypothetical protein
MAQKRDDVHRRSLAACARFRKSSAFKARSVLIRPLPRKRPLPDRKAGLKARDGLRPVQKSENIVNLSGK